jgi:hypothetical protein
VKPLDDDAANSPIYLFDQFIKQKLRLIDPHQQIISVDSNHHQQSFTGSTSAWNLLQVDRVHRVSDDFPPTGSWV